MQSKSALNLRRQVPVEETWDLECAFASCEAWEAACRELEDLMPRLKAFEGRISEGSQVLEQVLLLNEQVGILSGKIYHYASNSYSVDTTNQQSSARLGQARSLKARAESAGAFLKPDLLTLGLPVAREWVGKSPVLAQLPPFLDKLEHRRSHIRSAEIEQTLALLADPFGGSFSVYSSLCSADLAFKPAEDSEGQKFEIGQPSIGGLLSHKDRAVRRTAWENYADAYLGMKNTFASAYTTQLKQDVFLKRSRGYETSLHAALGPENVPIEVYHHLIEVFQKNLPTWHRYWRLKRKALGLEVLHPFDVTAPLRDDKVCVSYAQAVEWICEGMRPLGEDYVGVLRKGCLEDRWVDRACNKGKRDGAYSSATYGVHPVILMSWNDSLYSLSTLAHELGHAMHSYYSHAAQPYLYCHYTIFEAEVASNFNQAMVRNLLLGMGRGRDFEIAVIEEAMSNFHRYFFIMPILAQFELEVHARAERGEPLSADILIGLAADFFEEGYGGEVAFDRARIGIVWAQFLHLYMNFYVYQYTTGIAGAHALAAPILAGDREAVFRYREFLKSGGSKFPINSLRAAGVDLASPEPIEHAFAYFAGLVDRLERLLNFI